ncbi:hypothetical protein ALC57_10384 [Trachymyrmex cornetzi]|nr:hypothetical protein ALC57_10384 [Trachymyrmex cornetzi]
MIGQNLSTPLSGLDAQKKFSNLRSTFGRLYKKVVQSQPKSGSAGNHPVYIPSWPLYNELLFLKDAIKPRK